MGHLNELDAKYKKTKDATNGSGDCLLPLYLKDNRLGITVMPCIFKFYIVDMEEVSGNLQGRGY